MNATKTHASEADAIRAMFAATDRGDLDAVTAYFHDDVVVVLSNREPIHGAREYVALYGEVAGMLAGLRHEIHDIWTANQDGNVWVVRMTVHYTRQDGGIVSLPCCNVLRFADDRISDYQVFMDMTPVFA